MVDKKEIIQKFFDNFGLGNAEAAIECLDNDVIWHVMGKEGGLPVSGKMDKEQIADLIVNVSHLMKDGIKFTYNGWTIEDSRIAVEMISEGELKTGEEYNNFYHLLIIIENDKINLIKEYMDTEQVKRLFIGK